MVRQRPVQRTGRNHNFLLGPHNSDSLFENCRNSLRRLKSSCSVCFESVKSTYQHKILGHEVYVLSLVPMCTVSQTTQGRLELTQSTQGVSIQKIWESLSQKSPIRRYED